MDSQEVEYRKNQLADSVGEFIKYWGFKEIHGKLWVQIYLSDYPVTAKELTSRLGVTKGLVSTALAELIAYNVVEKVPTGDSRSPGYQSNTDLVDVINNILRNRELKLTTRIQENIGSLAQAMHGGDQVALEKLNKMREMTGFAVDSLRKLLDNKTISMERFKFIMKLIR
jgi:DNA-binding transcriptional regulator GbsR (MarR family)